MGKNFSPWMKIVDEDQGSTMREGKKLTGVGGGNDLFGVVWLYKGLERGCFLKFKMREKRERVMTDE